MPKLIPENQAEATKRAEQERIERQRFLRTVEEVRLPTEGGVMSEAQRKMLEEAADREEKRQ